MIRFPTNRIMSLFVQMLRHQRPQSSKMLFPESILQLSSLLDRFISNSQHKLPPVYRANCCCFSVSGLPRKKLSFSGCFVWLSQLFDIQIQHLLKRSVSSPFDNLCPDFVSTWFPLSDSRVLLFLSLTFRFLEIVVCIFK